MRRGRRCSVLVRLPRGRWSHPFLLRGSLAHTCTLQIHVYMCIVCTSYFAWLLGSSGAAHKGGKTTHSGVRSNRQKIGDANEASCLPTQGPRNRSAAVGGSGAQVCCWICSPVSAATFRLPLGRNLPR